MWELAAVKKTDKQTYLSKKGGGDPAKQANMPFHTAISMASCIVSWKISSSLIMLEYDDTNIVEITHKPKTWSIYQILELRRSGSSSEGKCCIDISQQTISFLDIKY